MWSSFILKSLLPAAESWFYQPGQGIEMECAERSEHISNGKPGAEGSAAKPSGRMATEV